MKKNLLLFLLFASTLLTVRTYGQVACNGGTGSCNLIPQDVRITIKDTNCVGGIVYVTFDINFKLAANNGNKQIFFHSWLEADYPTVIGTTNWQCAGKGTENGFTAGAPGFLGTTPGALGTSILDIALINDPSLIVGVEQEMTIRPTDGYPPDPTVFLTSPTGPGALAPDMKVVKTLLGGG